LIDLVAALGPVNDQQLDFIQKAEKFLGLRADEIAIGISTLERHGLMLHQAGEVRIVPDVLSDYLLEQRCWDEGGNDTHYGESIFAVFRESHLANITQNLEPKGCASPDPRRGCASGLDRDRRRSSWRDRSDQSDGKSIVHGLGQRPSHVCSRIVAPDVRRIDGLLPSGATGRKCRSYGGPAI
jgi:hypothetical protein